MFLEPTNATHRQYEALRAFFVDKVPSKEVAERFGTLGEVRNELRTGEPTQTHTSRRAWLDQGFVSAR